MKTVIKKFIPIGLWRVVRKRMIIFKHRKVAKKCDELINSYFAGSMHPHLIYPKKEFEDEYIIWQYWGQGFDNVPEAVRICLDSVERHKGNYKLIRLSDDNLSEYIDFPKEIIRKRDSFQRTAFSDLLRLALLATYGGVWLDATTLLTDSLPTQYFDYGFFLFQRDENEVNKDYWENSYAYYWGWYEGFKVRVLNSIIYAQKENNTIQDLYNMMCSYWLNNNTYPYYFFFQILFDCLVTRMPDRKCPVVSDCLPHYTMQIVTDNFSYISFEEVLKLTSIHKMTYKIPDVCVEKLKNLLKEIDRYGIKRNMPI